MTDLCEYTLKLIALGLGTWFWLWYLTWETEYHHREKHQRRKWYEREIKRKNGAD